ncbi:glycerol-3-phosphate acyltransferase [Neobacillus terrae]|uniref:glycerol-3-phosphate acyltransferase n=1 Tax=Neobacillus terrae TaxID=3034837 RepID=UPI00140E95D3|nr:glycerol-3-phosphate acyltransferase [Neobacillus terrae]NHM31633.1 glycerol-3-phosphate acyltransferase [Neobacillus terrae]
MLIYIYLLAAYFLGNFLTGFFIVRLLGKKDIRQEGSGNPGARNAGRTHGKLAFVLTFLGDALKGALVVLAGEYAGLGQEILLLGLGAALVGHIKPILFRFRGGMGISAFIGGMLAFEPLSTLVIVAGFLIFYPLTKSFTIAGLISFILIPISFFFLGYKLLPIFITVLLVILILFVHAEDIRERFDKMFSKS